jgi:transcriptional regulator
MSKPQALVQGTLSLLILKILDLEPLTGWAISQRLRQMSNETLQASHGSLYPALHRLEHEGWISGKWQELEGGRPTKIYSLTRAGQQQLAQERAQWQKLSTAINGILESN